MRRILLVMTIAALSTQSWAATPPATQQPQKKPAAVKTAPPAVQAASRAPASIMGARMGAGTSLAQHYSPPSTANNSKDISEELKIMGQSRNLSMGLLFQKDKDKLTFGTPRTNYQDKISDKTANF